MIHISYKLIFVENHKDESAATSVTTNGRCFTVSVETKCKETCHQHRMDESNYELEHRKQSDEFEQDIEMRLDCLRRNSFEVESIKRRKKKEKMKIAVMA